MSDLDSTNLYHSSWALPRCSTVTHSFFLTGWPACSDKTRRDYGYTTTTYADNLDHGEWSGPHACYGSDDVLQGLSIVAALLRTVRLEA